MAAKLGLIAEDRCDVDVLAALAHKISPRQIAVKSFIGHGCGKIVAKCHAWAEVLAKRGCTRLVVVHDLDERNVDQLHARIASALAPCPIRIHAIVIPVKEIEAWLLADQVAVKAALGFQRAYPPIANPQTVPRPKEHLRDLIYTYSKKKIIYINTIHNPKIAHHLTPRVIGQRCPSFLPFQTFVLTHL